MVDLCSAAQKHNTHDVGFAHRVDCTASVPAEASAVMESNKHLHSYNQPCCHGPRKMGIECPVDNSVSHE